MNFVEICKMRAVIIPLLAAMALTANAQWTPTGGGDHQAENWTCTSNLDVGGSHTNINKFTIEDSVVVNATSNVTITASQVEIRGQIQHASGITVEILPTGAPALLTPPNDTTSAFDADIGGNATFTFETVGGSVTYNWQVSTASDFSSIAFSGTTTTGSFNVTFTTTGTYYWRVNWTSGGYTSPWSVYWKVDVDALPPTVPVLTSPADGVCLNTSPIVLDWSDSTDPENSTPIKYDIEVATDSGFTAIVASATDLTVSQYSFTPPGQGKYYWHVRSKDSFGNTSAYSAAKSFTYDTTPPTTPTLTSPANNTCVPSTTPTLNWSDVSASEPNCGVTYSVTLNGSTAVSNLTTNSWTVSPALANGSTNTWSVTATDGAGNSSTSGTFTFTVDVTPPAAFNLLTPADGACVNTGTPTFDWSDSDGTPTTCGVTYDFYLDGSAVATGLAASTYTPGAPIADGSHTWKVQAKDGAGNTTFSTQTFTIKIDTQFPTAPTLLTPADNSCTNNTQPTFDWTDSTDNNVCGSVTYTIKIDTVTPPVTNAATGLATSTYTPPAPLAQNTYYWQVIVIDAATNQTASTIFKVTVDTTGPATPTNLTPADASFTADTTPTLTWTVVADPCGVTYEVQVATDAGFATVVASVTGLTTATWDVSPPLTDGTYFWHVRGKDGAGNNGNYSTTTTFIVDSSAPAVPTDMFDDFENSSFTDSDPENWTVSTGSFSIVTDGAVKALQDGTAGTDIIYAPSTQAFGYWKIRFRANAVADQRYMRFYITANTIANPPDDGYYVYVRQESSTSNAIILRHSSSSTALISTPWTPDTNYHTVEVVRVAPTGLFYMYVDGSGVGQVTDVQTTTSTFVAIRNTTGGAGATAYLIDEIHILSPANGGCITTTTPLFNWGTTADVGNPPTGGVTYDLDCSTNSGFSSFVFQKTGLASSQYQSVAGDGLALGTNYFWRVRSKDNLNNTSNFSSTFSFSIDDGAAPSTPTLLTPTNGSCVNSTPTLDWSDSTDVCGVTYDIEIASDAGFGTIVQSKSYLATSTYTVNPALTDGTYFWHVRAVDGAGNVGTYSGAFSFVVDTQPPAAFNLLTPADGACSNSGTPTFDWADSSDPCGVTYDFYLDAAVSASGLATSIYTPGAPIADGSHTWYVKAKDSAGNTVQSISTFTIKIDTVAPSVVTLQTPATGTCTNDQTPTFDWTDATDADVCGGGIKYDILLDTANPPVTVESANLTTSTYTPVASKAPATYYWRVVAKDSAGNSSQSLIFSVTIDITPPTTPTLTAPANGSCTNDQTPTFTWSDVSASEPTCGVSYDITVDGSIPAGGSNLATPTFTPASNVSTGLHTWSVTAKDGAGNSTTTTNFTFTIDITVNATTLTAPANNSCTNDQTPTFTWTAVADGCGVVYDIYIDGAIPAGGADLATTTFTPGTNLAAGTHPWFVRTKDGAGNTADSSTFNIIIDLTPPAAFNLVAPPNGQCGTGTPTFDWQDSSDPCGVTYRIQVDNDVGFGSNEIDVSGLTTSTYTSGTPLSSGSTYYWKVTATDSAGNSTTSATFSFVVDTTAPPVPTNTSPANGSCTNNTQPTFTWNGGLDENDALCGTTWEIQIDNNSDYSSPEAAATGLTSQTYTPGTPLADGTYYWHVRAKDGAGNTSAYSTTFTVKIDSVATAPNLLLPANNSCTNSTQPPFDWSDVVEECGQTYDIQVDDDAAFGSPLINQTGIAASQYSGYAQVLTQGTWYWRVRTVSGSGATSTYNTAQFIVDTTAPNPPTLLTPANNALISDSTPTLDWTDVTENCGATYDTQVATDSAFANVVATGTNIATSQWDVTPALGEGSYYWRVRARDGAGNTGNYNTTPFKFTLDLTPPTTPTLLAPADGTYQNGANTTFDWTDSTDANGIAGYTLIIDNNSDLSSPEYTFNTINSDALITGIADGTWYWTVFSTDNAGNNSGQPTPWTFVRDTQGPDTTPTTTGFYGPVTWPGAVTGTASDAGSGVQYTEITIRRSSDNNYWNGGTWVATQTWLMCTGTSNWSYAISAAALNDGVIYTVTSRGTDNLGNQEGAAGNPLGTSNFTWDSGPPTVTISTTGSYTQANWPGTINGTAFDSVSGIDKVYITIRNTNAASPNFNKYWNGAAWVTSAVQLLTAYSAGAWQYVFNPTSGDTYEINANSYDKVMNVSSTVNSTFTYTDTSGGTALDSWVTTFAAYNALPVNITGGAQGTGLTAVRIQIQDQTAGTYWTGAVWGAATWLLATGTTSWSYSLASSTDGHTYVITSRAEAGATLESAPLGTGGFIFDTTLPLSSITVPTANGMYSSTTWPGKFMGTATDPAPAGAGNVSSGVKTVWITIKNNSTSLYYNGGGGWTGAPVLIAATGTTNWQYTFVPPSSGSYTVTSLADDNAGNVEATAETQTFAYDAIEPDTSISTLGTIAMADYPGYIAGTAADSGGSGLANVFVLIQRVSDGMYWNGTAWGAAATWLTAVGTSSWKYGFNVVLYEAYQLSARAKDKAGNLESTPALVYLTVVPQVLRPKDTNKPNVCQLSAAPPDSWPADLAFLVVVFVCTYGFARRRSGRLKGV